MSASVLLYNADGVELMRRVSLHKAWKMIWRGVAQVLEVDEPANDEHLLDIPKSIRLVKYHYAKWKYERTGAVPFSKRGVFIRDNYTCAYCGIQGKNAFYPHKKGDKRARPVVWTVDHVLPKWQKHALTWNNAVSACEDCNQAKGGRSPEEAKMPLLFKPRAVTFEEGFDYTTRM